MNEQWLIEALEALEQQGLTRLLRTVEGNQPETVIDGKHYILASSNNYLGLSNDDRVKEKAIEAIFHYGTGCGGSRLTSGNTPLHLAFEREIAQFKHTEDALLFSSGFLANVGTLSALADEQTIIFSDELNHASIIEGCRLSRGKTVVYRHNNIEDLKQLLKQYQHVLRKIIVTDGVFSMDGDLAHLDQLRELSDYFDALLIVDDAHATGVVGNTGRGTAEYFHTTADLTIGTMSKALGSEGGFVCGKKTVIDYLKQRSRPFIFQTALAPASVAAASESLRLIQEESWRIKHLMQLSKTLREALKKMGYTIIDGITPIIPIIIGDAVDATNLSRKLEEHGVFIPAIRPPTVPIGTSRLRCTLMATHNDQHLKRIANAFKKRGS